MELHERLSSNGANNSTPNFSGGRDPFAEVKNRIHLLLISDLGPQLFDLTDSDAARERALAEIREQLQQEPQLSRSDRERLAREISDDVFGYGPIEQLISDPSVSEIMVNGHEQIWIERDGKITQTGLQFSDEAQLRRIITKMVGQVGRRIDESSPMVDARLPDGSRVNAIIAPLSLSGPLLTIRRFSAERFDLDELIRIGTMSQESCDFLCACIKAELNLLISGGTGTGKTTMLNALSAAVPDRDRIVTIEDAAELQLKQKHTLRLESRPKNIEGEGEITIRELVRNALRMRPDRIIVGEVRGPEALDMLQAMNTGHEGSLSTIHANSPRDALSRLETMVLMAGMDLPVRAIREQISAAVDVIVQQSRMRDGSRKVTHITEVQGMEGDKITLQDVFLFEQEAYENGKVIGSVKPTGVRPKFMPKIEESGIQLPPSIFGLSAGYF
jgi:pilus assembly protein CpaF